MIPHPGRRASWTKSEIPGRLCVFLACLTSSRPRRNSCTVPRRWRGSRAPANAAT
jgi:hypothetical protein